MSAVFGGAKGFNGDLSSWNVGKVTTMERSTYTHFSSSNLVCVLIPPSIFWFVLIIFNLIKCLFSSHFHRWTVVVSVSAVFAYATNFNGDLSSWNVDKVGNMWTSTLHFPSSNVGWMLFPRSIFWFALMIFNLIKCLFSSPFYAFRLLLCACECSVRAG